MFSVPSMAKIFLFSAFLRLCARMRLIADAARSYSTLFGLYRNDSFSLCALWLICYVSFIAPLQLCAKYRGI